MPIEAFKTLAAVEATVPYGDAITSAEAGDCLATYLVKATDARGGHLLF